MTTAPEVDSIREQPSDIEAERAVLGASLLSADAAAEVAAIVTSGDYYRPQHQVVHEVITGMRERGQPVDPITVAAELARRDQLAKIGGAPYLHTLTASVPHVASAGYYAQIVARLAAQRRYIETASRLLQHAYRPGADLAELDAIAGEIMTGRQRGRDLGALAGHYVPVDWEAAWKRQPDAVDWLIEPVLEAGTVNALFAKPGTGKSLLALEWALRLVRKGRTVVYVDDENRLADVVERLQAFGAEPGELRGLLMYSFAGLPALDTPAGGAHLQAIAASADAALVVLDTTTRMVQGKENDSDTFLQLYRCSLVPLKSRGITVLRLDHPGKDGERGQRGSSAKDGDVDTIWRLTEEAQGRRYKLAREKSRSGHGEQSEIAVERRYAPLRHVLTVPDRSPENSPAGQLAGQLDRLGVPPSAGRDRCRTALNNARIAARNDLLSEAIRIRKYGLTCPGQVGDSGTGGDPGGRLSPVPPSLWEGTGGQADGHPSPDAAAEWPEGSYGETAS